MFKQKPVLERVFL